MDVYYHVRVTPKSSPQQIEVRLDLLEEELEARFLRPYREGRPIVIGGKTISPDDIERIQINTTEQESTALLPRVVAERQASNVITWHSNDWYVANIGRDVTDRFVTGPPGTGVTPRLSSVGPRVEGARVVFVVHGRDLHVRDAVFAFLRAIGLHPLEWIEVITATGKSVPYVGEVLDHAFSIAQAVVVVLTPDDEARLREPFQRSGDPPHEIELTGQARPNVLFEAGMAMGRDPDHTILVELGGLRPFSDIGGRHVVRLDNSTARRQEFALRLKAAGCPVNLNGVDWHTVGDLRPLGEG